MDDLIARLRARAADPERRIDSRPTSFAQDVRRPDLGGLLAGLGRVRADLDRTVAAARAGRVDRRGQEHADAIARSMSTPVPRELPEPVTPEALDAVEARLRVRLPAPLRRIYAEVADGGFGPGAGLLRLEELAATYAELRTGAQLPRGISWPEGRLPLVNQDPGYDCVDCSTGRIVAWDPEGLSERSRRATFERSFRAVAPSVEAWLADWLAAPTFQERMADQLAASRIKAAREARARIAAKTPEERARMGLPEVGWERVVWGGLGLDDDAPR